MPRLQEWIGYGEGLAGLTVVTVACLLLFSYGTFINYGTFAEAGKTTTAALSYLLVVLITASRRGLGPGILASVIGMICFDFFFTPPLYTLTLKDPHDWVAFAAFLVTATIANRLLVASRTREREALWHRGQVMKLYRLSCAIIINLDPGSLMTSIAQMVQEAFGYRYCGVFQKDESGVWRCVCAAQAPNAQHSFSPAPEVIETVYRTGNPSPTQTAISKRKLSPPVSEVGRNVVSGGVTTYVPSKAGSKVVAVLVFVSNETKIEIMDAIASLVALALERARLLNDLRVKDALKQSDELKSALLASVSHNLRTPLTSIQASVESILATEAGLSDPNMRELHLIISEEVNRLSRIVDHLLEMARVEAGELRLKKDWTSASEIVDNALQSCAATVRNHRLLIDCAETIPLIKVDPRILAEVLTNLIENAAKYSPEGSEIAISAGVNGDTLTFCVADHGPGIAPEEAERIFDKFYRGTQPNHKAQAGTGMGLAIARGLMSAHSGKIWVESNPGGGAMFKCTLPVDQFEPVRSTLQMGRL